MTDWGFCNEWKNLHVKALPGSKKHWNTPPKLSPGWTVETVKTTLSICVWAWENNMAFMTEVPMLRQKGTGVIGDRRADIVIPELSDSQVIEVYDSEPPESIEAKRREYEESNITFLAVPADPEEAIKHIREANGL